MWYRRALVASLVSAVAAVASADVISSTPGLLYYVNSTSGVTASGGLVSGWNDLSGNGNNFTGAVGSQPTLTTVPGQFEGHPVVQFNGSTSVLTMANPTTPHTVFIVGETTLAGNTLGGIWGAPGQDKGIRLDVSGSAPPFRSASSGNSNSDDFPTTLTINGANTSNGGVGTPYVLAATGNAANILYSTSSLGDYFAGRSWGGNIAAVVVYDGVLTSAQQFAISNELGGQFGINTPEPSTWVLGLLGAAGLLIFASRQRRAGLAG
jgi:hypothetical protein